MRWVDEPLSELGDVLYKILRVILIEFPQESHLQSEESVRARLIFLELGSFLGPSPHIFPDLLHVALKFPPAFALVGDVGVCISETEENSLGGLLFELIDADPQYDR